MIGYLTLLEDPELVQILIRCLTALTRFKKLSDQKYRGVTNLFLASADCEVTKKISRMVYPKILEDLMMTVRSQAKKSSRYCEFEKLLQD